MIKAAFQFMFKYLRAGASRYPEYSTMNEFEIKFKLKNNTNCVQVQK